MSGSQPFVIVLEPDAPTDRIASLLGLPPGAAITRGSGWAAVAVSESAGSDAVETLRSEPGVRAVVPVSEPYRIASRSVLGGDGKVALADGVKGSVGGPSPIQVIVSSSWAAKSEARLKVLAPLVKEAGCAFIHAGRLYAAAQQDTGGVSLDGLRRACDIAHELEMSVSVEVGEAALLPAAAELADVLQVSGHSMQDFSLLREFGRATKPVLLRRGVGATIEEFLLAAEYVLAHGNGRVVLCESGIRTFDSERQARFEIGAVPVLKRATHLPLLVDPSHTVDRPELVPPLAKAAIAAGADGLVLEVAAGGPHDREGSALDIEELRRLLTELRPIARVLGRGVGTTAAVRIEPAPHDADGVLRITDRTLGQTIESLVEVPPDLDVVAQWRLEPPGSAWLSPPLSAGSTILGRCTGYRMGAVRLSRNIAYVDLGRIDPTLAALLQSAQLSLGQLFVDPRIEKHHFEFGTHENAGEIDAVLRTHFAAEIRDLHPYVWRRYQATIEGVVAFVVIEALPATTWRRLLAGGPTAISEELAR